MANNNVNPLSNWGFENDLYTKQEDFKECTFQPREAILNKEGFVNDGEVHEVVFNKPLVEVFMTSSDNEAPVATLQRRAFYGEDIVYTDTPTSSESTTTDQTFELPTIEGEGE